MAVALIAFLILVLSHREILFAAVRFVSHAVPLEEGPWDLALKGAGRKTPTVYLMNTPFIETVSLSCFNRYAVFISTGLWNSWNTEEKTAYLHWCYSTQLRALDLARILGFFDITIADRDTLLLSQNPSALIGALEKTIAYRVASHPSVFGSILAGLSFIGPALLVPVLSPNERLIHLRAKFERLSS